MTPLYELRQELNITGVEMAKLLNVTKPTEHRWETGEIFYSKEAIINICETLSIDASQLLEGDGNYLCYLGVRGDKKVKVPCELYLRAVGTGNAHVLIVSGSVRRTLVNEYARIARLINDINYSDIARLLLLESFYKANRSK